MTRWVRTNDTTHVDNDRPMPPFSLGRRVLPGEGRWSGVGYHERVKTRDAKVARALLCLAIGVGLGCVRPATNLDPNLVGQFRCSYLGGFCRDLLDIDARGRVSYSSGCCLGVEEVARGFVRADQRQLVFKWTTKPDHWKKDRDRAEVRHEGDKIELVLDYLTLRKAEE